MLLQDQGLLRNSAFINGEWITTAASGESFTVLNPFDGSVVATLPEMSASETNTAIAAAEEALPRWRDLNPNKRKNILDAWVHLINENINDLAKILTTEQGKPLAQAIGEYEYTMERMSFYAGECLRITGQILPATAPHQNTLVLRQPFGVTAGITPWNYPAATVMNKLIPAIAAGNTMVLKPAPDTPLTTLALMYLGQKAGLPKGVVNIVLAKDPAAIGNTLTTHPSIRKFSFTGSTAVGRQLYKECSHSVKNIALELGGNSPFIVFEDADINAAATEAAGLKFANCGQICVNANRFYIHENIENEFIKKFTACAEQITLGNGIKDTTTMGPMINQKAIEKVESLVTDATSKGAEIITGGKKDKLGGLFYQPTILTNMKKNMRITKEEIFGPIAAIYTFNDEKQVIKDANDTEYGLAAYFYTKNLSRAWRVATALQSGTVCVNAASGFGGGPFGGYKQSGIGREQGRVHALDEWCEVKSVSLQLPE